MTVLQYFNKQKGRINIKLKEFSIKNSYCSIT